MRFLSLFVLFLIIYFRSTNDTIGKTITQECSKIFPLENVLIKKVKVLKKPKFDLSKLMELYNQNAERKITTAGGEEAKNKLSK